MKRSPQQCFTAPSGCSGSWKVFRTHHISQFRSHSWSTGLPSRNQPRSHSPSVRSVPRFPRRKQVVHWFRQDLRLDDNPALSAAAVGKGFFCQPHNLDTFSTPHQLRTAASLPDRTVIIGMRFTHIICRFTSCDCDRRSVFFDQPFGWQRTFAHPPDIVYCQSDTHLGLAVESTRQRTNCSPTVLTRKATVCKKSEALQHIFCRFPRNNNG